MRHSIAENDASSYPTIVAMCCSKAGAGKFFVSKSAHNLFGLALMQLDSAILDEPVDEVLTRVVVSCPLSIAWIL